jgi:hypothetical protein
MSLGEDRDLLYEKRLGEQEPQQTVFKGNDAVRKLNDAIKKANPRSAKDPKTYCMDLDGVLLHHETGWPIEKFGEPLTPGIQMAKRIKAAGHRLVILTARPKNLHHTIEGILKGVGVKADQVTNMKPPAEVYVDDRAIQWPKNYGAQAHVFTSKREAISRFGEGGPGSGPHKGVLSFYHGTSAKNADSIRKNGITPTSGSGKRVWVSESPRRAQEWAGKGGVVVRVELPGHKVKVGDRDGLEHSGKISPEQIKEVVPATDKHVSRLDAADEKDENKQAWIHRTLRTSMRENGGDGIRNGLDGHRRVGTLDTGRTNRESKKKGTNSRYLKNGKKKPLKQRIAEGFYPEIA